jgi:hypothetical protein
MQPSRRQRLEGSVRSAGQRLGQLLVGRNTITTSQCERALEAQQVSGERLGSQVLKLGFAPEQPILRALSFQVARSSIGDRLPTKSARHLPRSSW